MVEYVLSTSIKESLNVYPYEKIKADYYSCPISSFGIILDRLCFAVLIAYESYKY